MRIVVKLGSSLLSGSSGVNTILIDQLASQIMQLSDHKFAIVTSGAISTGMKKFGLTEKPKDVALLQALAAIGQSDLIRAYENSFDERKILAQVLLTNADFSDRMRYLNIHNTLMALISRDVIPIINENDTVTVMDIKKAAFGDNDSLSAHISAAIDADLLIILTNVDGLYDRNPKEKGAKLIKVVNSISDSEISMCSGTSELGRGGMLAKVRSAKIATEAGVKVIVANGLEKDVIIKAISGSIGTTFNPSKKSKYVEAKHWLAFASAPKGKIVVNNNAMQCAVNKNCGINPIDIISVTGPFDKGDVIEILDSSGSVLCKGITNYFSHELDRVKGKSTEQIYEILGFAYENAVNSSDMVVT